MIVQVFFFVIKLSLVGFSPLKSLQPLHKYSLSTLCFVPNPTTCTLLLPPPPLACPLLPSPWHAILPAALLLSSYLIVSAVITSFFFFFKQGGHSCRLRLGCYSFIKVLCTRDNGLIYHCKWRPPYKTIKKTVLTSNRHAYVRWCIPVPTDWCCHQERY